MALRRRLMGFLAILSLGFAVYAGVSLAFSATVDEDAAQRLNFDGHGPAAHSRAVVLPLKYSTATSPVATFATGGAGYAGHPGALLAVGTTGGQLPATATNVSFVRALLFVPGPQSENDTIFLESVPMRDANGNETLGNLTLNLSAVPALTPGYIVKADGDAEPRFVTVTEVIGQVPRFDPPGRMTTILMAGLVGFTALVGGLIVTHTRSGTPGVAGHAVCAECRSPLTPPSDFCVRCGAYRPKEAPQDG